MIYAGKEENDDSVLGTPTALYTREGQLLGPNCDIGHVCEHIRIVGVSDITRDR